MGIEADAGIRAEAGGSIVCDALYIAYEHIREYIACMYCTFAFNNCRIISKLSMEVQRERVKYKKQKKKGKERKTNKKQKKKCRKATETDNTRYPIVYSIKDTYK